MNAKPKIIIYRNELLPSSETFIREQGEHLTAFLPLYAGLQRVNGLDLPQERVVVLNEGSLKGRLEELCFKACGVSPRLLNEIRNICPRLIHAHFEGGGMAALPLARALKIPLVVTCHGYDVTMHNEDRWRNPLIRAVYLRRRRELQRDGNIFIAVSEFIKQRMLGLGYPAERTMVHYIGVDTERFKSDPSVAREPVVLFVGRLVEKKGCEYLIRAMTSVESELPGVRLVIIGDGPLRAGLEYQARVSLRHFDFLGMQPPECVSLWMNRARVLCVPTIKASSGDTDGCSMVFPEAQAMGLPVVSFNTGGTPEAVLHLQTGLLASERDSDGLGDAILRLLTDTELWNKYSEAGRIHVEQRFNLAVQTQLLEELYGRLVLGT